MVLAREAVFRSGYFSSRPCHSSGRQAVDLSSRQLLFSPSSVCVRFLVDLTIQGQVSLRATQFSAVIILKPVLHDRLNTTFFRRMKWQGLGASKQTTVFRMSEIIGQQSTAALFFQSSDF
jgi:hypothetical protein